MPSAAPLTVRNPGTGATITEVPTATSAEVELAVRRARAAQPAWGALPFAGRARALRRLTHRMLADPTLVDTIVGESGKPPEWTPLTSLRIQALWRELGLPEGVFQVVTGKGDAGQALCREVDMIFFTGSQKVGRQIARDAGERLIPVVLELGGKSPMLVL